MKFRYIISNLERDLQTINEKYSLEEKRNSKKDKNIGMRSVKARADNKPSVTKMDFLPSKVLKKIAKEKNVNEEETGLNEKRKGRKRRPGRADYYRGTRKSNKSMEREINKCAKEPRPKSCYDYWDADKKYDKAKNESHEITREEIRSIIFEVTEELEEKKKRKSKKLSAKTRKTLKKKAENANMPLGALTAVYRKGLAAWLTGHRQGVPQHQWAMARVNSFIRGGKTRSVDKAEWKKVQNFRKKKKK